MYRFVEILATGRYDGSVWSAPRDLTACVPSAQALSFCGARLAIDENGHLYAVAGAGFSLPTPLWYTDDTRGSWSAPAVIPGARSVSLAVSHASTYDYSIAVSNGTAYVAYVRYAGPAGHGPG